MKKMISKYNKNAIILTLLLLLAAFGSLLWIVQNSRCFVDYEGIFSRTAASKNVPSEYMIADIYQNGELIQSIPLTDVDNPYTFTIIGENNCQNEIKVQPGSIGITSADCPDKLCVHQGFISTSLLPITCLPNHLVIQIRMEDVATGEDSSVDVITY